MNDERTYKIIGAAMEVHRTDVRRQRAEDRKRRAVDSDQMSEDRGQKAEVRGQRTVIRTKKGKGIGHRRYGGEN